MDARANRRFSGGVLALACALAVACARGNVLRDSVVGLIFQRQAGVAGQIHDLGYSACYRYVEEDLRSGRRSEVACTRRVHMMGFEHQRHDFQSVAVNGKQLRGEEMQQEIRDLKSKGLVARKSRMPFLPETRNEFTYRVLGSESWRGREVWSVGFEPKVRNDRTVRGKALVLKQGGDIVRLDFAPARLPFVVDSMSLRLDYESHGDLWLPSRFRLDLSLRLALFRRTLLDRHISIDDSYSDYRFNSGLTERFFEEE
jgi:hypothetical protein